MSNIYTAGNVLPKGESLAREFTMVEDGIYRAVFTCSKDSQSESLVAECTIDIAALDRDDLIELAARSLVIDCQARMRKQLKDGTPAKTVCSQSFTFPLPKAERGAVDPKTRLANMAAKGQLTKEQILEIANSME